MSEKELTRVDLDELNEDLYEHLRYALTIKILHSWGFVEPPGQPEMVAAVQFAEDLVPVLQQAIEDRILILAEGYHKGEVFIASQEQLDQMNAQMKKEGWEPESMTPEQIVDALPLKEILEQIPGELPPEIELTIEMREQLTPEQEAQIDETLAAQA